MLGAEPDWRLGTARAQVRAELERADARRPACVVRLDCAVEDLPVGERQRLEILKALYRGARILILDEPTAVLTPQETEQLFVTLRQLRERGTTILLITHKLKEIMALCDGVTVMRAGAVVLDARIGDTSVDALAQAMVGRRVQIGREAAATAAASRRGAAAGAAAVQWRDALGVARLADVALTLRAGEIVGVAGVSGNGQSELLDVLAGMLAPQRGRTDRRRARASARTAGSTRAPRASCGVAHVPEDRHRRGAGAAVRGLGVGRARLPRPAALQPPRLDAPRATMRADCATMMARYDVRPRDPRLRSSQVLRRQPAEAGAGARGDARADRCCWWASRRAASTSAPSSSSTAACVRCATPAVRCWWSRPNSTRSSRSPTA